MAGTAGVRAPPNLKYPASRRLLGWRGVEGLLDQVGGFGDLVIAGPFIGPLTTPDQGDVDTGPPPGGSAG